MIGDVWHDVEPGSFDLDSYEFYQEDFMVHGGGQSGVCAKGFACTSKGARIAGPLDAVQAVSDHPMSRGKAKS